jgi:hypothetical protein
LDQLGLVSGQSYFLDFFSCDRQPCASTLRIKTSIYFKQQQAISAETIVGSPGAYKIIKYLGGNGSCGSAGDSTQQVPITNMNYKLMNSQGLEIEALREGSFHGGGIVIATPHVTVDTSKIHDLPPGNYRIIGYEPANAKIVVGIPIAIVRTTQVELEAPFTGTYPKNTLAPIHLAYREGGALVAKAGLYSLVIPPGLSVFADSSRSLPVVSGATLTTAPTGLDTLYASNSLELNADQSYTLSIPMSSRTLTLTFLSGSSSIRAKRGKVERTPTRSRHHNALGRKRPVHR